MAVLAPMTDLEAVNRMLSSIGQAPVNTIPTAGVGDAAKAAQQLLEATRDIEAVGYCWNTDTNYTLNPDADGAIMLPNGTLDVFPTDTSHFQIRMHPEKGQLSLYDADNQTFAWTTSPVVNIIWGFEFNNLPQAARSYIATAAARRFQAQIVSSPILDRFNEEDEARAFILLQRYERRCRQTNSFTKNTGFQSWLTRRFN